MKRVELSESGQGLLEILLIIALIAIVAYFGSDILAWALSLFSPGTCPNIAC